LRIIWKRITIAVGDNTAADDVGIGDDGGEEDEDLDCADLEPDEHDEVAKVEECFGWRQIRAVRC
jgi:hypothetical protein